jgi:hypothetical protein
MAATVALVTLHGMGETKQDYALGLFERLAERLGKMAPYVEMQSIFYQDILQENETRVWERVQADLRWKSLRQFILYGFADAAGLENGKEKIGSVYTQVQLRIAAALYRLRQRLGDVPLVMLAQSLGGHIASCYFWDVKEYLASGNAPSRRPRVGMWQAPALSNCVAAISGGKAIDRQDWDFIEGGTLQGLFTTGCNIPVFVAAHAAKDILPFAKPGFPWHNFFDKDDVLGWPLASLSTEYAAVVSDHAINAGGKLDGWIMKCWNPLSHTLYWETPEVLKAIEQFLSKFLDQSMPSDH